MTNSPSWNEIKHMSLDQLAILNETKGAVDASPGYGSVQVLGPIGGMPVMASPSYGSVQVTRKPGRP